MSFSIDTLQNRIGQATTDFKTSSATSTGLSTGAASSSQTGSSFMDTLNAALDQTSALQDAAQTESLNLLTGQGDSVHSVVLAAEKADLSLRLTLQVRNKVLDAYNEIMRMQV